MPLFPEEDFCSLFDFSANAATLLRDNLRSDDFSRFPYLTATKKLMCS
jgi:hypothetical protein